MNKFILYHHKARRFAEYVENFSYLEELTTSGRATVEIKSAPNNSSTSFAELPDNLRKLLFFAKPDVIICLDDGVSPVKPIFAFEITNHVPARDHWLQRFNNLVGCAQIGIPGAYVLPFDLSLRPRFSGILDSAFFYAYDRVTEIHQTPFYIADWESDDKISLNADLTYPEYPDHNSVSMVKTFKFLKLVIDAALNGNPNSIIMRDRLIVDLRDDIRRKAYSPVPQINDFRRLTYNSPAGNFLSKAELFAWIRSKGITIPANLPDRIKKRDKNLIFTPIVDTRGKTADELRNVLNYRIKQKGADPYLGQPLAFDYIFCRLGQTPYERDANLIIDLSVLLFADLANYHKSVWERCPLKNNELEEITNIPQYTMFLTEGCAQVMKNLIRVYSFTADIIIFGDGMVYF